MSTYRQLFAVFVASFIMGQTHAGNPIHFEPSFSETTTHKFQTITDINVILNPGCFINIRDNNDIEVNQSTINGSDPFMTYYGCGQVSIFTTFPAFIQTAAKATSVAGGVWSVTLNNQDKLPIPTGATSVTVCVLGTEVAAHQLITTQAQDNVPVAEITIQIIPQ